MKKTILLLSFIVLSLSAVAQFHVIDGEPMDSTIFTFDATDSLHHSFGSGITYHANIDTSHTHLWQIGKTSKVFFSGGADTTFAIMTDTSNPYPANSNDWFILKIKNPPLNVIVDFYHKYRTLPQRAGGIVEFSTDSGANWHNVIGDCTIDTTSPGTPGIYTEKFYGRTDTLKTGEPAFTGIVPQESSRVQFFTALPLRLTGGDPGCSWSGVADLWVRFRFVSDTTTFPPFEGWMIDSIKIEGDKYEGSVSTIADHTLNISPNPSNGFFNFPELKDEKRTTLEITNAVGQTLFTTPYTHRVDLSRYPKGLYLYKVVNSTKYYSGRLVVQ